MSIKPLDIQAELIRVLRLEGQAIISCADRLTTNCDGLQQALRFFRGALDSGGKIIVTGIGKSGKVAQKTAATLSSTGSLAIFLHATEGLHGDLGIVAPNDAVLAFSYTGNTDELIKLLPSLKNRKVPIVGIGGNAQSQLAQQADAWIDASVAQEACPHNLAPTTSTTLALALGDAIAVTLMQLRGFNEALFANNHPGGSIGRKLTLSVADLMHKGSNVGLVEPTASMDQVIVTSTQKKLGAVLVVNGPKLLGIITDGDIRRALRHREKFFALTAAEVMTSTPVTITPDAKASEALHLMENRPSQISVIPVTDKDNNWQGLLRLHDLINSF
jgi:arabinose-5-phosphate isomerase